MEYFPQIFLPQNLEHAKEIILSTGANGEKWQRETEATAQAIVATFARHRSPLSADHVILDYGCGIGRIAKRLIELTGCTVIGADISPGMLAYSIPYVNSGKFVPCPVTSLPAFIKAGMRFDGAIASWTLQHCLDPVEDLRSIHRLLKTDGLFYVVNRFVRHLPVTPVDSWARWHDDRVDVLKCIESSFDTVETLPLGEPEIDYHKVFRWKATGQ